MAFWAIWTQFFPPGPAYTEANVGTQTGKVFIVTGGASGVGFELASLLYTKGATIYIAGRSEKNGREAIAKIEQKHKSASTAATSKLNFLYVDFSDLKTVKPAVQEFLRQESRLDVLWNNAGVGATFNGETAAQGLPIQFATNCVAPQLFTRLLQPALERASSARVVWVASTVVDSQSPKGGMRLADFEQPNMKDGVYNYTASKVGNWFLASEFAKRDKLRMGSAKASATSTGSDAVTTFPSPVIHIAVNPGNLRTAVWRTWSRLFVTVLSALFLHDAIYGAYAELYAGLSPDIDGSDNGGYVIPWGRKHPQPRVDIMHSLRSEAEGGSGTAAKFYAWCAKQSAAFC